MPESCTDAYRPQRTRHARRLVAALAALCLVLAACSDSDSNDSASTGPAADDESPSDRTDSPDTAPDAGTSDERDTAGEGGTPSEPEAPEDAAGGGNTAVPATIAALAVGRQIIFTGDVVVESADVAQTTTDMVDAVSAAGGAIWGQDTRTSPESQTVLTIRVPPADFDRVLAAIAELDGASPVSQTVSTDDVTEAVVDLDARTTAAESSVARVQALLDKATDLNTIFTLEEELATRQADLERLRGQRKTIGDQVTLATITLTILQLDPDRLTPEMDVVAWVGENVGAACPGVSDLSIGADGSAVLCVNVSNNGDDTLTEIDVQSPTFRLRTNDFTVNEASTGTIESLAPGEELLVHAELEADGGFIHRVDVSRTTEISVVAAATPATSPSVELTGTDEVLLTADVDDPLPGFGDSFSGGLGAMLGVLSVLMIAIGAVLPFVPLLLVLGWLGRRIVARNRRRSAERDAAIDESSHQ